MKDNVRQRTNNPVINFTVETGGEPGERLKTRVSVTSSEV